MRSSKCGVNHRLIVIAVTQIQNHRQAFMQSYVAKYTRCPRTHAPEKKGEIFIKEQINNPNEIFFLNGIQEKNSLIRPIKAF
jgi:translation initiation factor 2 beta subunit (eIF-2beta)/eIF-5